MAADTDGGPGIDRSPAPMLPGTPGWLAHEVEMLLPAGRIGLYEFIWFLNGVDKSLTYEEKVESSQEALSLLMTTERYRLAWFHWGRHQDPVDKPVPRWPAERDWADPRDDEPYLAILPNG